LKKLCTYQEANFAHTKKLSPNKQVEQDYRGGWENIATQRLLSQVSLKNTTPPEKLQNPTRSSETAILPHTAPSPPARHPTTHNNPLDPTKKPNPQLKYKVIIWKKAATTKQTHTQTSENTGRAKPIP
jgi:D-alanyl-D-alanine carboxypeptidase